MPDFFKIILDFFKSIGSGFLKIFSSRANAANNIQPDYTDDNKSQNRDFKINRLEKNQNCSAIPLPQELDLDSEITKLTTKNDELSTFIQDVKTL
jgi:hypothetical protein